MESDVCNTCKKIFLISDLLQDAARTKGYRNECRGCANDKRRLKYRSLSPTLVREYRHNDPLAGSLKRKKEMLDKIRDVPCLDCNGRFPTCAMDFDHLRDKLFGIMGHYRDKSMEELLLEIAKCEIVCSNCHRVRTNNRRHML